jgi:hypothetical protein
MRPKGAQKRVSVRRPEFRSIRVANLEQPHRYPVRPGSPAYPPQRYCGSEQLMSLLTERIVAR